MSDDSRSARSRTTFRHVSALRSMVAICALLLAAMPSSAAAQEEGAIGGGGGGRYFKYDCGTGRLLVGLRGSAGVLIDNVQAVCARVDAAGNLTEAVPQGPVFGNPRPQDQSIDCPPQHAIIGGTIVENNDHPQVGSIEVVCREISNRENGGSARLTMRGGGNLKGYRSPFLTISGSEGGQSWWDRDESACTGYATGIHGRQGTNLTAFGLLCGPKPEVAPLVEPTAGRTLGKRRRPGSAPGSPFASLVNSEASFQAVNFPDRYIRHAFYLGIVEPAMGNYASITFRVVPGLGGRCVSLQSKDFPDHYLRHQNWRIKLSRIEADPSMRADATFCMMPGLATTTGISFEAVSAPGHFIRHRNFELWLDRPDESDQFRKDATFLAAPPGGASAGVR